MAGFHLLLRNITLRTRLRTVGTPRGKAAARLRLDGVADLAPKQLDWLIPGFQGSLRQRRQQCLGIGMTGVFKNLVAGADLHALAQICHHDIGADVLHHTEVVGHKHIRQPHFILQIHQQVQDLGLDRHIQRRHRLIAHDKLRVYRQRSGHADALAPSAVQFVGVGIGHPFGQTHGIHQLRHPAVAVLTVGIQVVYLHGIGDQIRHAHARIQAGIRVLKNHAHFREAIPAAASHGCHILSAKQHLSSGRLVQTDDCASQSALAASGFAHHTQRLPLKYLQIDTVHRMEHAALGFVILFQFNGFNDWNLLFQPSSPPNK